MPRGLSDRGTHLNINDIDLKNLRYNRISVMFQDDSYYQKH